MGTYKFTIVMDIALGVLAFLVAVNNPDSALGHAFAGAGMASVFLLALILYPFPAFVAHSRKHH